MLRVEKLIKLTEKKTPPNILKIKPLNEKNLIIIDTNYRFYLFDKNLKAIRKDVTLIKDIVVDENFKALDIYKNQIALTIPAKHQIAIVELDGSLKKKAIIDFHNSSIELVKYSTNGEYLITASHDGQVYILSSETYQILTYLPVRKDFISTIEFSNNDRLIIANYFDKKSVVFDMLTYLVYDEFSTSEVVEASIFFENNSKIFLLLRGGKSYIYDIKSKELKKYKSFKLNSIHNYQLFKDRYLILSDRDRKLFIYDLNQNRLLVNINYRYLITATYMDENNLYLSRDNSLEIIDKNHKVDEIEIHFMVKNYFKISKCIEENVLLKLNEKFIKVLNSGWQETLPQIIENINEDRQDEARRLAYPFFVDEKTEEVLEEYLTEAFVFKKFNKAVEIGNLELAYTLALNEKNHFLRESREFKELEKYWLKIIISIKRHLKSRRVDIIKKILAPFFKVPIKKELINLMLNKPEKLEAFDELALKKDFKNLFEYVEDNKFFKESDSYKRVLHIGLTIYEKFNKFFENREYEKCVELAKTLTHFSEYKSEIDEKLLIINNLEEIKKYFEAQNFKRIFEIIEDEEELFFMSDFYFLIDEIDEIFKEALKSALRANPKETKEILEPFIQIDKFENRVKFTMQLAYINELEKSFKKRERVNWQNSIDNFVNIFGVTSTLNHFLNKFKLSVELNSKKVKSSDYLNSIVVLKP